MAARDSGVDEASRSYTPEARPKLTVVGGTEHTSGSESGVRPAMRELDRETPTSGMAAKMATLEARATRPFSDEESEVFEPKQTARIAAPQLDGLVALTARAPTQPPPAPTFRLSNRPPRISQAGRESNRAPRGLYVLAGLALALFMLSFGLLFFFGR